MKSWVMASRVSVLASCSVFILAACTNTPLERSDAGIACTYAGVSRASGSNFPSMDGCNTCICLPDGEVACTNKACGAGGATGAGGGAGAPGAGNACGQGAATDSAPGWILFDSDRDNFNRDVYAIRADGSGLMRLTGALGIDREPASSPDGRWVAFTSDRSSSMQIHLLDRQQGSTTQVTSMPGGAGQPSFSHAGNLIAFASGGAIYTIHPDGTGQTLVTFRPGDQSPYASPHFAVGDQELVVDRQNEIDAAHLDSSGFRTIVQNWTTTIRGPSVSPAGGEVAYYVFCGGDRALSIWTTPFATTTNPCEGRRLTPPNEPKSQNPAWGPGDVFAYERVDAASNVGSIALIARAPGSAPCILTPGPADNRNPTWSP
jgi:hypothetical protein